MNKIIMRDDITTQTFIVSNVDFEEIYEKLMGKKESNNYADE